MHGSLEMVQKYAKTADVHGQEKSSGRTALHKAAFWGHTHLMSILVDECKIGVNVQDSNGDTALNDAVRFGHVEVVKQLLAAGSDGTIKNREGHTAQAIAVEYAQEETALILTQHGLAKSVKEIEAAPASQQVNGETVLSAELSGKVIESLLDQIDQLQNK